MIYSQSCRIFIKDYIVSMLDYALPYYRTLRKRQKKVSSQRTLKSQKVDNWPFNVEKQNHSIPKTFCILICSSFDSQVSRSADVTSIFRVNVCAQGTDMKRGLDRRHIHISIARVPAQIVSQGNLE